MAAPAVQEQGLFVPTAEVVGNAFARQYYSVLQQSPALVHRFYQDISKLGRIEDGGAMSSTTTMKAIDEKIQCYGNLKADIKFIDAQESFNGGVIVLVNGWMINADNSRRSFTQTFFLAPQEPGYFVLNDIFRYLEDDFSQSVKQEDDVAPVKLSHEENSPVQENNNSEQCNGEVYNPSDNGEVPVEEVGDEEEEEPVAEVVDEAPAELEVVVDSNVQVEEAPKKSSYASIVMKDAYTPIPSTNVPKSVPKTQEQRVCVVSSPLSVAPTPSVDIDGHYQEHEGDGHSIYIRNLPIDATYAMVEEELKRFGPIKSGGIQIRNNKGFCFGFVEFEVGSAIQSAIEASPFTIGGREVVIEEKKSTNSRGSNRGRFSGRGGGFRGEGGRGRGSYSAGRSHGRGENNKNDFARRGGGRGFQNRVGEGYQRSETMGNGTARVNPGGGSGFGTARAQRVSAQA